MLFISFRDFKSFDLVTVTLSSGKIENCVTEPFACVYALSNHDGRNHILVIHGSNPRYANSIMKQPLSFRKLNIIWSCM